MYLARLRLAITPGAVLTIAVAFGLWLALLAVVVLLLRTVRTDEIDDVKIRGAATTALLQAHTGTTFRAVENLLVDVAKTLERENLPRHDAPLRAELRKLISSMPYVRAVYVIGPSGSILHDTNFPRTPDVSLADRPYFRQYLQKGAGVAPISAPMLSRSGAGWFVAVTRGIGEGADFRGVAAAAIELDYFSDLYRKAGLGEGSEILLFHRDGRLIAQHPGATGAIGESYSDSPLFKEHLSRASQGAYLSTRATLPYPRVVSYAALPDIPLVVAHVQNMSERLAPWRKWAWTSAGAMFLLLVVILYSVAQYLRAQRDRQIQQERIAHGEKMEALGQLTGGIAHDFANILGVLAGNLGVIRMLGGTDPRLLAALDRAQRAVKNGTTLTRQLMAFARKRPLQVREHDVNDAVSSTLTLLEQAAGPECRIVFDPGELPRPGLLDHTQLEMALLNLVLNARHAIEGSGRITISTRSVSGAALRLPSNLHARRYVCVSVADNGRGMPEEVLRRATEPLFTTKGEKGTGFGLAQVYGLMREVGGELSIASRVGEGTTVNLCFPEAAASGGTPRTVVAT